MPNTILVKKSGTASAVPSSLSYGELAINYADGRLFYKNAAGSIVSLTANSGLNAKLDALTFNGATTTFNLTSSSVAVTPANANCLLISLNGVIQEPGVSFTLSGSQITFSVAPASTDVFFGVHLTGGAVGGGSASGSAVTNTPAQITSNQNNYALPTADIVRLSADATRVITGFQSSSGAVVTLYNVGSFDIRITHEDTSSTAANRVTSATGSDVVIAPNDSITLAYDSVSSRWRTAGSVKAAAASGSGVVYEFTRSSAPADATGFSGAYTWTLPTGAKVLELVVISGGGGGGSGMRGAAGTTRSGGGGGGCSGIANYVVSVASLSTTTASIAIGAGGGGGAAVSVNDANGNTSASGGATTVDFGNYRFTVGPGRAVSGVATSASAPGALTSNASGAPYQFFGEAGKTGGVGAVGTAATTSTNNNNQFRSGAGGGGINSSNTAFAGGDGANSGAANYGGYITAPAVPTGGAATGGSGGNATFAALPMTAGAAGAGGGGNASGAGGTGGNGAYGGGGGGGGASVNGFNSGAGGNGGDGYLRITVWF